MPQIARAKGFARLCGHDHRKRIELMVAEFQREFDAIEPRPVCQRDRDKN